jgi:hypothetical protein
VTAFRASSGILRRLPSRLTHTLQSGQPFSRSPQLSISIIGKRHLAQERRGNLPPTHTLIAKSGYTFTILFSAGHFQNRYKKS